MPEKYSRLKKNLLIISISLVLVFFIAVGINTFYPGPTYDDFCDEYRFPKPIPLERSDECPSIEYPNAQEQECSKNKGYLEPNYDSNGCLESYSCNTCDNEFRTAKEPYERNVFVVALILGITSLVIGILLNLESVSSGIMGGGILTIIYAVMRYWGELQDYARFIILGIVLAILIWFGYKKFKK
jgi:hypothetical protein